MIPWFRPPPIPLGPLNIEPFGIMAAAGILLAMSLLVRGSRRRGLDPRPPADFAIWGVLGGVVGGHLLHVLAYHPEELTGPLALLRVWDGLSSTGGLLGGLLTAIVYFRVKGVALGPYLDVFALAMAPGWGVARIGCFLVHDHPGRRSEFLLAVRFPDGPRHDLGMYDMLALFAISAVLYALDRRGRLRGRLLGVLAVLYGAQRFALDFLRAEDVGYADARYLGLTPAQYICIGLVAWGAYALARRAPPPAEGGAGGPVPPAGG